MRVVLTIVAALLLASLPPGAIAQAPSPANGLREGLKVHGHWVIDIRQPDGTLVSHREFQNAVTSTGIGMVVNLLSRQHTAGFWYVTLFSTGPICAGNWGCVFSEPNDPDPGPAIRNIASAAVHKTLQVTHNAKPDPSFNVPQGTAVILTASVTAVGPGSISSVRTSLTQCATGATPADCRVYSFSEATLGDAASPKPVTVAAGQLIQITVTLTFS